MAGYSGTPLAKKLGIKADGRVYLDGAPANYMALIEPLPEGVSFVTRLHDDVDMIHIFTKESSDLSSKLPRYLKKITANGVIWVSWPKKASRVPTDITEDVVRQLALPLGLVDTKVCAVDEVWSGLKLVIRLENRR
jgi:hypothetical protein